MIKIKNLIKIFLTLILFGNIIISTEIVNAGRHTAHPHPEYYDIWNYGIRDEDNWAYSDYWLQASGWTRLGSQSSVTDIFGNVKDSGRSDWKWANAGAYKQPWWIRADSHYGWYKF
ncbi:MAG: bacteriocin, lactococcin 972 family protein [Lactobacillales bacterium]|nr:bacteriocin, lactococcin 972 family protein [Lactobacillales bacterium]